MAPQKKKKAPRRKAEARNPALLTWFDSQILEQAQEYGGFYNAHAHIDRGETLEDHYLSHIGTTPLEASRMPLPVKQELVGNLHDGEAYTREDLVRRMSIVIERQIAFGVTRLDTNIDATPDLDERGLLAINVALELKRRYAGRLDIRIAPTPIFGFKKDPKDFHDRWEVFAEAARKCDYLSLLPEKDDYTDPSKRDGRLGFKHHIRKGVELACELGKEVQFHLDQMNIPGENGTERMLELLEGLDVPVVKGQSGPTVWVIHMISPSAYDERRFASLIEKLLRLRVGVIVCPTAAISMRQMRSVHSPTHNSIARMLELIKAKVPLRLGTDNIADTFVPSSDGDMLTEIKVASNTLRLYQPSIWAKLACGKAPNNVDIETVGRVLYEDFKACKAYDAAWRPAIE